MDVKSARSLSEYFHDAVAGALRNQGVETTELRQFYIVRLLGSFGQGSISSEAWAVKMCEGLSAQNGTRAQKLREIGDTSLFVSGFFPDSLNRSLIDVDYYIGMGEIAYGQLAHMPGPAEPFADVF